jgi:hypothetical protein
MYYYIIFGVVLILLVGSIIILYLPDKWFTGLGTENFELEINEKYTDNYIITKNDNIAKPGELEEFEVVDNIFTDNSGFNIKYVPATIEHIKDGRYSVFTPNQVESENGKCNWCRVVKRKGDIANETAFITCAIRNMFMNYPYWFRSQSQDKGFRLGRHAYMRDANKSGVDSYCRILKDTSNITPVGQALKWEVVCNPTKGLKISNTQYIDPNPPKIIKDMLVHYKNCILWVPLHHSKPLEMIRDYPIYNIGVDVNEIKDDGRKFNYEWKNDGTTSRGKYLNMSTRIPLHYVRSVCFWVKYNTVWKEDNLSNVRSFPKWSRILDFFHTPFRGHFTIGNIDTTGDIFFEIWHDEARVMRLEKKDFFVLDDWVHVCFTTGDSTSNTPEWKLYKNGFHVETFESGHIPWDGLTNAQWIGRSGDNEDDYFNGEIKDIRLYQDSLDDEMIKTIMEYGKNY